MKAMLIIEENYIKGHTPDYCISNSNLSMPTFPY